MTKRETALLAAAATACSCLALACAGEKTSAPPRLASARVPATQTETRAERELGAGEVTRALATADRNESLDPGNPWGHYDRAVALEELGRTSDAAQEFLEAESRFAENRRGRAISIYGRAHALASAGMCREAKPVYEEYAAFVRTEAPRKAAMALQYADDCIEPIVTDRIAAEAGIAVVAGDYTRVLKLVPKGDTPWLEYDRAVAFAGLRRTDDAVTSFRSAEHGFRGDKRWERSIAIYGRARALTDAHRCAEATDAYAEYAASVRPTNPHDADLALVYARDCHAAYHW